MQRGTIPEVAQKVQKGLLCFVLMNTMMQRPEKAKQGKWEKRAERTPGRHERKSVLSHTMIDKFAVVVGSVGSGMLRTGMNMAKSHLTGIP
jgi:hypothetical protein